MAKMEQMRKKEPSRGAFDAIVRRSLRTLLAPRARHFLPLFFTLILQSVLTLTIAFPLSSPRYSVTILEDFFYVAFGCSMLLATLLAHQDASQDLSPTQTSASPWPPIALAPLSSASIVLARFTSCLVTCILVELLTLPIPLLLLHLSDVSAGHIVAGYLGLAMVQAAVTSTALFFATLTARKLLAITLTALTLIAALIPWMFAPLLPPAYSGLLVAASFFEGNFQGFMAGRITLLGVTYYASITCFMLTAAITTMRARRLL